MPVAKKKSLVIVESPTKAKTIERYLGEDYKVLSSGGHVRDLPSSKIGVDVENHFLPTYEIIRGKNKTIEDLRKAAKASDTVFLAPDPDREGEAIAWHIAQEIEGKAATIQRVTFNEITKSAIREAIQNPREVNLNLVNAQQARRVLDRLVGYSISPLLWRKFQKGLSAGRVQSVAVRMICDREREILAFLPKEYWTIEVEAEKPGERPSFVLKLASVDGDKKFEINTGEQAQAILDDIVNEKLVVSSVNSKRVSRNPYAPFITSTLQQEAARKLRFANRHTMRVAQALYEGMEVGEEGPTGLITYMRTDSTRISNEAMTAAREYIAAHFGAKFVPEKPNVYKAKNDAQDAHEAIRPTSMELTPERVEQFLDRDQFRLYKLIWDRFLASQMAAAQMNQTRVEVELKGGKYVFAATGSVIVFPGFLSVYEEGKDERTEESDSAESKLPAMDKGDNLNHKEIKPLQHFTQPPPRYSESSLVKELEAQGIGRPSTYAAITQTIQDREYVEKEKGRFKPTERGMIVTDMLTDCFPEVMDIKFTALMEDQLDHVEDGSVDWVNLLHSFYKPFHERLETAEQNMRNVKREVQETDIVCDKCGAPMVIRWGKNGRFLACSAFPKCRNTKPYESDEEGNITVVQEEVSDEKCEACGLPMLVKSGRRGRFLACSGYPECKTTRPVPIGIKCPQPGCPGQLVERRSKRNLTFYACNQYPTCKYSLFEKPRLEKCAQCEEAVQLVGKGPKENVIGCPRTDCPYEHAEVANAAEEAQKE